MAVNSHDWRQALSIALSGWGQGDAIAVSPPHYLFPVDYHVGWTGLNSHGAVPVYDGREKGTYQRRDDVVDVHVVDLEAIEASRVWYIERVYELAGDPEPWANDEARDSPWEGWRVIGSRSNLNFKVSLLAPAGPRAADRGVPS